MKKFKNLILPFLLSFFSASIYAVQPICDVNENSLQVLKANQSQPIKDLQTRVEKSACDEKDIFAVASDSHQIIHNRLRCDQIELCSANVKTDESKSEAQDLLKKDLRKAALIGAVVSEINEGSIYNITLSKFEDANKTTVCPVEEVDANCEKEIKTVFSIFASTGFFKNNINSMNNDVKISPLDSESVNDYIKKNFYTSRSQLVVAASKDVLANSCAKSKLSVKRICKMRDDRLAEIANCEKGQASKGCLDKEQNAIGILENRYLNEHQLFLAMEKELCSSARVSQITLAPTKTAISRSQSQRIDKPRTVADNSNLKTDDSKPNESDVKKFEKNVEANSPSSNQLGTIGTSGTSSTGLGISKFPNSGTDEVKGFLEKDGKKLNENFSDAFRTISSGTPGKTGVADNTVANAAHNAAVNEEFTNNYNYYADQEKKNKEAAAKVKADQEAKVAADNAKLLDEKKKTDDMNALLAQISGLKDRIANIDKQAAAEKENGGSSPTDQAAIDREKTIQDLKKSLAGLEADKKKLQDSEAAAAIIQQNQAKANLANSYVASTSSDDSSQSSSFQNNDQGKKASRGPASISNENQASYIDRSPAVSGGANNVSSIVLRSNIVYMTNSELQKYPYHLGDNASISDIEQMILKNNGAPIILGTSEQIIPVVDKGVVQLDEEGRVRYKRIKISVVKNERERKQNIAREISSIADLKRAEQKKRDLIRYQEMKNTVKVGE